MRGLEAGVIAVNGLAASNLETPFGGVKNSGDAACARQAGVTVLEAAPRLLARAVSHAFLVLVGSGRYAPADHRPVAAGPKPGSFSALPFDGDVLRAVESINAPADHMALRRELQRM